MFRRPRPPSQGEDFQRNMLRHRFGWIMFVVRSDARSRRFYGLVSFARPEAVGEQSIQRISFSGVNWIRLRRNARIHDHAPRETVNSNLARTSNQQ